MKELPFRSLALLCMSFGLQPLLASWFLPPSSKSPAKSDSSAPSRLGSGNITLRHIEAGGIGYNDGYTSLTGVAFLPGSHERIWPFFDVRGHEFNNNTQAANAGFGMRFSTQPHLVLGFNGFYDYRNSDHSSYHQVGVGLELLGRRLDLRLNGYFPIGKVQHTLSHCVFNHYIGDYYMSLKKIELALPGVNFELGGWLLKRTSLRLYGAVGAYYYRGNICHYPLGGEGRVKLSFAKYLFLEGRLSHDAVFNTRVQGVIGLSFPLGRKPGTESTQTSPYFNEIPIQSIQRHEIIVLKRRCQWKWNF